MGCCWAEVFFAFYYSQTTSVIKLPLHRCSIKKMPSSNNILLEGGRAMVTSRASSRDAITGQRKSSLSSCAVSDTTHKPLLFNPVYASFILSGTLFFPLHKHYCMSMLHCIFSLCRTVASPLLGMRRILVKH